MIKKGHIIRSELSESVNQIKFTLVDNRFVFGVVLIIRIVFKDEFLFRNLVFNVLNGLFELNGFFFLSFTLLYQVLQFLFIQVIILGV